MTEARIQQETRLEASKLGVTLFRNNCGAYREPMTGRLIQYGVGNPGGSDLIGWTPLLITPDMVGRTVAIFTAVEVKTPTGRATPAQINFIDAVTRAGGFAGIVRDCSHLSAIVKNVRFESNR